MDMKQCMFCGNLIDDKSAFCPVCNASQQPQTQYINKKSSLSISAVFAFIIAGAFVGALCMFLLNQYNKKDMQQFELNRNDKSSYYEQNNKSTNSINDAPKSKIPLAAPSGSGASCFDVVDTAEYYDEIQFEDVVIVKIIGKEDATVKIDAIVKNNSGDVIDKDDDEIEVVKGETNYFKFSFSHDKYNSNYIKEYSAIKLESSDLFQRGDKNGVELKKYNRSGYYVYLTLKQSSENIGDFSRFKVLFYKDGKIVYSNYDLFSFIDGLQNKGDEVIAEVAIGDVEFDALEYIFQP